MIQGCLCVRSTKLDGSNEEKNLKNEGARQKDREHAATGYDKSALDHRQHETNRGQRDRDQKYIIERLI